jgi:hypothetical protein
LPFAYCTKDLLLSNCDSRRVKDRETIAEVVILSVKPIHRHTASAQFFSIEPYALFELNTGFGEIAVAYAADESFDITPRGVILVCGKKLRPQIGLKLGMMRLFSVAD